VGEDELCVAVPWAKCETMVRDRDESFLVQDTWTVMERHLTERGGR
jgi:hypothetical protein